MVIGYRMVLSGYAKPGSDIPLATPSVAPATPAIQPPSTGGNPFFTAADAEPLNSVLLVLSCGSEWGGAESGHGNEATG